MNSVFPADKVDQTKQGACTQSALHPVKDGRRARDRLLIPMADIAEMEPYDKVTR